MSKGAILLHGATVEKNSKTSCFIGWSGAGKTTILLGLLFNYNYRFLSNDQVIFSKKGELFAFPTKIQMHGYVVEQYKEKIKTSLKEKVQLALTKILHKMPRPKSYLIYEGLERLIQATMLTKYYSPHTHLPKNLQDPRKEVTLFLLSKQEDVRISSLKAISKTAFRRRIQAINNFEWQEIIKVVSAFDFYCKTDKSYIDIVFDLISNEKKILENIQAHELTIPRKINIKEIKNLISPFSQ